MIRSERRSSSRREGTDRAAVMEMRSRTPGKLLSVVLLVLFVLSSYQLWLSYRHQVRSAEMTVRNLAVILAGEFDALLRHADADLQALSDELPLEALNPAQSWQYREAVEGKLRSRLINVDRMVELHVHNVDGGVVYTSGRALDKVPRIDLRESLKQLQEAPKSGVVFSFVPSGPDAAQGPLLFAVRALRDGGGKIRGVACSTLNLENFKEKFKSFDIGESGAIALRRMGDNAFIIGWGRWGSVLSPETLPAGHPLLAAPAPADSPMTGIYSLSSTGGARILGALALSDYPFYFSVELGRSEALSGWYWQVVVVGLSVLMVAALLGMLLLRLGRMRIREAVILTDLAQSESQFTDLAQLVPVGICQYDASGRCVFVNGRYLAIVGRGSDELIGSERMAFVHPDDRQRVSRVWEQKSTFGQLRSCEYRLLRPDDSVVHVIGEAKIENDTEGNVIGDIVALTDITPRKMTESELLAAKQLAEQANMTKTRFLAAASHDLRQPIQAINLFKDALCRTKLDDEQKSLAQFLSMSVHALSELLYSLLDMSKLDAGLVRPQLRVVEVEELFKAIDDEFSTIAKQRNLRLKFFYPFGGMTLVTDPGLLLSVLRNLVDNAFKYTRSGGVLVGVRKRGNSAVVQVWDTGIGIEEKYRDRIFDECFQVGNPARDRSKGLGIGLSIVRRTIKLLNGEVSFRSRPGKGTAFEITLPFVAAPEKKGQWQWRQMRAAVDAPGADRYARFSGWRVVVIEDDPVVAKSVELSLQSLNIQTRLFTSAEEALDSPDLLGADFYISDFVLPGANGIQLLEAIQERSSVPIKAVVMTGETLPDRVRMVESFRWRVLFKPADLTKLLALMDEVSKAAG